MKRALLLILFMASAVYGTATQVTNDDDSAYYIASPYAVGDLFEIQYTQSADVMYLVHDSYAPRSLSRYDTNDWRLETIVFTDGPFLDENDTATTLTVDFNSTTADNDYVWATATDYNVGEFVTNDSNYYTCITAHTSGATSEPNNDANTGEGTYWFRYISGEYIQRGAPVTVTSTDTTFSDGNLVNVSFKITHEREDAVIDHNFTTTETTSSIWVDGDWTFVTNGTWTGIVELQKSRNYGRTWLTVGSPYESVDNRNLDLSGTETEDDTLYRIECTEYTSGTIQATFTNEDNYHDGVVYITSITSDTRAEGYVTTPIYCISGTSAVATEMWAEGAWSAVRGYPRTVTFFEDRLVFGGTSYNPDTIWGSKTGDYYNMKAGPDDDEAILFTLTSNQINAVQWILGKNKLLIGTAGGEWTMAGTSEEPLTPSNVKAELHSTFGSEYLQANLVNESVLFFQRNAWKMRELAYNWEQDSYVSPDMTILAVGVTGDGVVQTAFQQIPDSILWSVREDGQLLGFSYERQEAITAWHRHISDGNFVSAACIHSDTGEDEIWVVVDRTIDGSNVKYIEIFAPRDFGSDVNDAYFVDCGATYTTDVNVISDLTWLEGESVFALADGTIVTDLTVTSDTVTLGGVYQTVHIGLPYTVQLKTMPLSWLASGATIQGRIKRINEAVTRYYNSGDFYVGRDVTHKELVSIDRMGSDYERTTFPAGHDRPGYVFIYQLSPEPLTLLALMLEFMVY